MDNDKAIATATAMVVVSALATGALYFSSQAGAGEPEPMSPTIVVEQIDAAGNPVVADVAPDPSFAETDGYGDDEYEDDDYEDDDYEDDDYEDDDYEDDDYEDDEYEGSH